MVVAQRTTIIDIQFNGNDQINFATQSNSCDARPGTFGVSNGSFLITETEGITCCPCTTLATTPDCGANDNLATSDPLNLVGFCNVTITVEARAVGGADGLECNDPSLPPFFCGPELDEGRDYLDIQLLVGGQFITLGGFCGEQPFGPFEVTGITAPIAALIITGGTQAADEAYYIDRILITGDPFSPVPASISATNNMPCDGQDAVILTAIGGNPGSTYEWRRDGFLLPDITQTLNLGIADMSLSGNYELTINDPSGCQAFAGLTVSVQDCAATDPDFTGQFPLNYCRSTDQLSLPNADNNGITGTWNVSRDLILADTVLFNEIIFTPDPGQNANQAIISIQIDEIPVYGDFPPGGRNLCFFNTPGQTFDIIGELNLVTSDILDITFNGMTFFNIEDARNAPVPATGGSFPVEIVTVPFGACGRDQTISQFNIEFIDMIADRDEDVFCVNDITLRNFSALLGAGNPSAVWTDPDNTGIDLSDPSSVDLSLLPVGSYTFQYSINATGTCDLTDQADLTIEIIDVPTRTISPPGLCRGEGFVLTINGNTYDEVIRNGEETVPNPNGPCDSLIFINLTFDDVPSRNIVRTDLCEGETFSYAGVDYTTDTNIDVSVPGIGTCDSLNSLMLTFQPIIDIGIIEPDLCDGDPFDFRGVIYMTTGITDIVLPGMGGECDTNVTLDLTFNPAPTRTITISDLCVGEVFSFDGVDYDQNTTTSITMANPAGVCDSIITLDLTFLELPTVTRSPELCEGDVFTFADVDYTDDIVMDVRIPDVAGGCDSIITLDLVFTPLGRRDVSPDLCEGDGFTFMVNGNTYEEGGMIMGEERFAGPDGCDSVITIDLFFKPNSETRFDYLGNSGDGFSEVINGTTYDESNPQDQIVLQAANGCDSVLIIEFIFIQGVFDSLVIDDLCRGSGFEADGPNGPYNEMNPTGIDTFSLDDGRDSFFITRLTFLDNGSLRFVSTQTSGSGYDTTINNVLYNEANPSGIDTIFGGAANGCDSVIIINIDFVDAFTTVIDSVLCEGDPYSINVDGTTFDESNPTGQANLMTDDGVDSIVTVALDFRGPDTTRVMQNRCQGDGFSVMVGTTVFDQQNPMGEVTLTNSLDCDSLVIVELNFIDGINSTLFDTICSGETVTVGSTIYGEMTQLTGTEMLTAEGGCDSNVMVMLVVDTIHYELCADPICPNQEEFELKIINTRPGTNLTAIIDGQDIDVVDTARAMLAVSTPDIMLTNDRGCMVIAPVDLMTLPAETLTIQDGDGPDGSIALSFSFSGTEMDITWSSDTGDVLCTDCTSVNVSSTTTATYTLEITDDQGCTYTDSFEVIGDVAPPPPPATDTLDYFLSNIIDPSAGTPNNALFLQTINPEITGYDIMIFNRWGDLVRELSNITPNQPDLGWDGRSSSNELQPSGVYVYLITIRRADTSVQQIGGDVLLVR